VYEGNSARMKVKYVKDVAKVQHEISGLFQLWRQNWSIYWRSI